MLEVVIVGLLHMHKREGYAQMTERRGGETIQPWKTRRTLVPDVLSGLDSSLLYSLFLPAPVIFLQIL